MKTWYQSKTIWIAALQGVFGVVLAVENTSPDTQTLGLIAILKSALDVILRFLSTTEIGGRDQADPIA